MKWSFEMIVYWNVEMIIYWNVEMIICENADWLLFLRFFAEIACVNDMKIIFDWTLMIDAFF